MLISLLTDWFTRTRAPRPPVALWVEASQSADGMVLRVKGDARVACAGALLDGLLAHTGRRPAFVTLDLSELRSITSLAVGVLAGYRRSVVRTGGQVRLVGVLHPAVRASLVLAELIEVTGSDAPGEAVP